MSLFFGSAGGDTIIGTHANFGDLVPSTDTIIGGAGNDLLIGEENEGYTIWSLDIIYAGDGDDTAWGGSGNSTLYGEAGDDELAGNWVDGGSGNDTIRAYDDVIPIAYGGSGDDEIHVMTDAANPFSMGLADGGTGNDTLTGQGTLIGGAGNDFLASASDGAVMLGGDGADTLQSGSVEWEYAPAAVAMQGGAGDDLYILEYGYDPDEGRPPFFQPTITEAAGGGTDTLRVVGTDIAVTLADNIENGIIKNTSWDYYYVELRGNELSNRLEVDGDHGILFGKGGNDTLTGDSDNDRLDGGDGNDLLQGRGAGDKLIGGAGHDTLSGDDGADSLVGGGGNDWLNGGTGADTMAGGDGNDLYSVDRAGDFIYEQLYGGHDTVHGSVAGIALHLYVEDYLHAGWGANLDADATGNSAANRMTGKEGNDKFSGLGGNDVLNGAAGNDTLLGGEGNDSAEGATGNDSMLGEGGADSLSGGAGNDQMDGGTGADTLNGGTGNDVMQGGNDNDRLDAGSGNDSVNGQAGNDRLYGRQGNDLLGGDDGNDLLYGESGSDTLQGGLGADTLNGGSQADQLWGGGGLDRFTFNALYDSTPAARDSIMDFQRWLVSGQFASAGDLIDLSAFDANANLAGNQAFTFLGAQAGAYAVWVQPHESQAGKVTLRADWSGDAVADLAIDVAFAAGYAPGLTAWDIVL